jgi:polygalacturonase
MERKQLMRRDLLCIGGIGLAAATVPAFSQAAADPFGHFAASEGFFNVRQYGAAGDGKTLDTDAINRTIEAAAAVGGGIVVFPAGTYLCFSIHLRSFVHLHMLQGCTIVAADSPLPGQKFGYNGGRYDAAEPNTAWDAYQDYDHNHWHNSLLWGEGIHDLSITGPGLIYGKGLGFLDFHNDAPRGRNYPAYLCNQPGVGIRTVALKNCHNVLFRDFSILKGGWTAMLLTGVDNVTIDNLKLDTERGGVEIDCCQNVRMSNCTVNSPWDDGICAKSTLALGYQRPTKNLTISNCLATGCYELGTLLDGTFKKRGAGVGRIKFGTESNGGFINIAITGCIFEGSGGFALESADGAMLEDIAISNTTMRDLWAPPVFLRLGARLRGPKETTKVGRLRRVVIDNLVCYNTPAKQASILTGIPGHRIEDVKLSNIYIEAPGGGSDADSRLLVPELENGYPEASMFGVTPASGFFLRHMRNLEFSHVEIATMVSDARPAFYLHDVERADFLAVTAPHTDDGAFALRDVKDFRVGWSRAATDTLLATVDEKRL